MLKNLFRKKECTTIQSTPSYSEAIIPNIPNGKWINCKKCKNIIYIEDIENNSYICPKCNYHFNISTYERVREIFDNKSFHVMFEDVVGTDPLKFPKYKQKIEKIRKVSNTS